MVTCRVLRSLCMIATSSLVYPSTDGFVTTPVLSSVSSNRNAHLTMSRSSEGLRNHSNSVRLREGAGMSIASSTALFMSDYDGGYDGGGQQEVRMEMQELHVEFKDDGRILLEVKGVKGEECREITEDLIKALGDVIHTENTSEYFEEKVTEANVEGIKVGNEWSYDSTKPEW